MFNLFHYVKQQYPYACCTILYRVLDLACWQTPILYHHFYLASGFPHSPWEHLKPTPKSDAIMTHLCPCGQSKPGYEMDSGVPFKSIQHFLFRFIIIQDMEIVFNTKNKINTLCSQTYYTSRTFPTNRPGTQIESLIPMRC